MPIGMPDADDVTGFLNGLQGSVHNWLAARGAPAAALVPAPAAPTWIRPPGIAPLVTKQSEMVTAVGPKLLMTRPPGGDPMATQGEANPAVVPANPSLVLRAGGMPEAPIPWTGSADPNGDLWVRQRSLMGQDAPPLAARSDPGNFPDVRGTWFQPQPNWLYKTNAPPRT